MTDREVRQINEQGDAAPAEVRQRQQENDAAKSRYYGDRAAAAARSGGMAVRERREYPVNLDGGGEEAPKASTAATTRPIAHLAEPGFWEDDEDGPARMSFLRRAWHALKDGPRPDPSLPDPDRSETPPESESA